MKQSLPCNNCKGLCCGPVPITKKELKNIRKSLKSMSLKKRLELENQNRYFGTCIFYDLNNDRCGIYIARPSICRVFGHYNNLICFRKPEAATEQSWNVTENPVGILSSDFTWKDFK